MLRAEGFEFQLRQQALGSLFLVCNTRTTHGSKAGYHKRVRVPSLENSEKHRAPAQSLFSGKGTPAAVCVPSVYF